MSKFSFDLYAEATDSTAIYKNPLYPILGLAGEAGEVADKVAKHIRGDGELDVEGLKKELGDVLWMVARICRDNNWSMGEVAKINLAKLEDRKQRNVLQGSGDNR
ncbi:hypothetical protein LH51_16620 [Nitrincola sp. A-D6]|uniref:nucleoside triphosphate pyrophosphohydrolase family protein n=1 Tax=Nitrincola sp. A-D6 TaxID=1545442 RepID=UPI00051FB83D|nr:nucleoside triphosphate pyrophosphohydrolase family protein [Nitrincola sp. A-D6]KGK41220.1 hypothetical protein LH51_16620 [Nitrincola sp. A-D6]